MPPPLTPLLASRGCGRLSVSHRYMHLQTVGLPTDRPISENHRSSIDFGEYHCSLPSAQSNVYWETGNERCLVLTIVSKILLFGFPDEHLARFESLCVDQLVYTSRWHNRVSETIGDLKQEVTRVSKIDVVLVSLLTISS